MANWIEELLALASQLPSGLNDPDAWVKLGRELDELQRMLARQDALGAVLEAADVAYYSAKSVEMGFMDRAGAEGLLAMVAKDVNLSKKAVVVAAITKYRLRARPGNPKDDLAEREAVCDALAKL